MQSRKTLSLLGALATVVFLVGCAEVPQQDIDMARSELDAAKTAEAEVYASAEYQAASDSLNKAMAEVEVQNGKFALFRSYDAAKALLQSSIQGSKQASQLAVENKEKIRVECDTLMVHTQAALEEAKTLLSKAPKGKEAKEALEAIQNDLTGVESALADAGQLVTNGKYMDARDRLRSSLDKTNQIKDELNEAIAKKKGR